MSAAVLSSYQSHFDKPSSRYIPGTYAGFYKDLKSVDDYGLGSRTGGAHSGSRREQSTLESKVNPPGDQHDFIYLNNGDLPPSKVGSSRRTRFSSKPDTLVPVYTRHGILPAGTTYEPRPRSRERRSQTNPDLIEVHNEDKTAPIWYEIRNTRKPSAEPTTPTEKEFIDILDQSLFKQFNDQDFQDVQTALSKVHSAWSRRDPDFYRMYTCDLVDTLASQGIDLQSRLTTIENGDTLRDWEQENQRLKKELSEARASLAVANITNQVNAARIKDLSAGYEMYSDVVEHMLPELQRATYSALTRSPYTSEFRLPSSDKSTLIID